MVQKKVKGCFSPNHTIFLIIVGSISVYHVFDGVNKPIGISVYMMILVFAI